ncbi:MAG: hypothetical protein ACP6IS_08135 [Candidatus Asgardarchaeia archaeon]
MNLSSPNSKGKYIQIVLIGLLSMLYAEVFSGASILWFIDLWSLLVTFPLYLSHTIFFLNLAIRLKRTSVSHLYLFGVLFGLYESWVTKVIWAGYFGTPPELGTFLGFAIVETAVIVFFWHPFLSFILPILTFEVLAMDNHKNNEYTKIMFPSHLSFLQKSKRNIAFFIFAFVIGSTGLTLNSHFNLLVALVTLLGTLSIIYIFYKWAKNKSTLSIFNLKLGKKGFFITGLYILLLYMFTFLNLLPDRIPSMETIILTILFYLIVIAIIIIYKPIDEKETEIDTRKELFFSKKMLVKLFALMILLITIFCVIPPLGFITFLILYHVAVILGPIFFIYTLLKIIRSSRRL